MKLKQALAQAGETLAVHNIEDARLESEILLRHTLNISRVQFYLDIDRELLPQQEDAFWQSVQRRIQGEPSAYITGHREFYGYDLYVDHRVLIPRPETELLVEKAIQLAQERNISVIADIGTGCGAIAISLALNLPRVKIYATDVSAPALEVARINCRKHGVAHSIVFLQGDLLEPLAEPVDLIVANLPYVKTAELTGLTRFEPPLALDGGSNGLDRINQLCRQAKSRLKPYGCLLTELGMGQANAVRNRLRTTSPSAQVEVFKDWGGIERVVMLNHAAQGK